MRRESMSGRALTVAISAAILLSLAALPYQAMAAQQDVTVTWVVPQDTSFSLSFIAGHTGIDFDPTLDTWTDLKCTDQTDSQWCYRVTNDGNVNINVAANFTAVFPTGITKFQTCTASSGDAPSGTCWWWVSSPSNETTQQTIISGLAPGSSADRWAWSDGQDVAPGTYTATYRLISSAA